jgi:hypothetical protein
MENGRIIAPLKRAAQAVIAPFASPSKLQIFAFDIISANAIPGGCLF